MANQERQEGGREEVQLNGDDDSKTSPPLSPLETILQAHPNITVAREPDGAVNIIETLPNWDERSISVHVQNRRSAPERLYPDILISGTPMSHDLNRLWTYVTISTEPNGQIQIDTKAHYGIDPPPKDLQQYAIPIPASEMVSVARAGLEVLEAYIDAPQEEKARAFDSYCTPEGHRRVFDGCKGNYDEYLEKNFPSLAATKNALGISYAQAGMKALFALNTLRQVTEDMLPKEPPQLPPG